MRRTIHSQRGIGIIAALFYILVILGVLTFILKLGPHYKEYLEVQKVMQDTVDDPELQVAGKYNLVKALGNRLYINYIESVNEKDFKFKKIPRGYLISVKYEVREHMFANIDVLLIFEHEVKFIKK